MNGLTIRQSKEYNILIAPLEFWKTYFGCWKLSHEIKRLTSSPNIIWMMYVCLIYMEEQTHTTFHLCMCGNWKWVICWYDMGIYEYKNFKKKSFGGPNLMFPTRRNCLFGSFLKGINNIDSRNFKIYTIHDHLFFSQLAISPPL